MRIKEVEAINRIQFLIGTAQGAHYNDKDPNHMKAVAVPLEEAFQICLKLLARYPPMSTPKAGGGE